MPRHTDIKILPYTTEQMFDLVADVPAYPKFLPWVCGARITSRSDTEINADLIVGFRMFRETFTSRVTLERARHIHVDYVRGPLKYLHNDWTFSPADGGSEVKFRVDFEFKSPLFERLVGALFTEAVRRMVASFEKRARELYGPGATAGAGISSSSATRTA